MLLVVVSLVFLVLVHLPQAPDLPLGALAQPLALQAGGRGGGREAGACGRSGRSGPPWAEEVPASLPPRHSWPPSRSLHPPSQASSPASPAPSLCDKHTSSSAGTPLPPPPLFLSFGNKIRSS